MRDPLAGTAWSDPATIQGFLQSPPNGALLDLAREEHRRGGRVAVDVGCGAGRNAVPLATSGWQVVGTDLSWQMLQAARQKPAAGCRPGSLHLVLAAMEALPIDSGAADLIVAHGIWNLARTAVQFRQALAEAGRIARRGAALFVFTFSRATLPAGAQPLPGEPFVFTGFAGEPQIFLTREQLTGELQAAGFAPDPAYGIAEHDRTPAAGRRCSGPPVIIEGTFRCVR